MNTSVTKQKGTDRRKNASRSRKKKQNSKKDSSPDQKSQIKDERRKAILKAAVKVFADKGYHGCRISDVANEAGVAYGLVYHYFGNKDALLGTIFETNWAVLTKALDEILGTELSTREKISQIVNFLFQAYALSPLIVKVLILEFGRSSRLGEALETPEMHHVFRVLAHMFRTAEERGELLPGISPAAAAVTVLGSIESILAAFVMPTNAMDRDKEFLDFESARRSVVTVLTHGLLKSETPSQSKDQSPVN
jgi:TetR/AcrR family transcriptional regulator, fatty acid metabolism regulator protein